MLTQKKLKLCSLLGVTFVTVEHFWPVENEAFVWKMAEQVSITQCLEINRYGKSLDKKYLFENFLD